MLFQCQTCSQKNKYAYVFQGSDIQSPHFSLSENEYHCTKYALSSNKIEMRAYITIRRVHSAGSNVANSIRFALFIGSDLRHSIGRIVECRIFDIRSVARRIFDIRSILLRIGFFRFDRPYSRMSNIRLPKHPSSDVGVSTFDRPSVECRIFDIRSASIRILNIR